MEAWEKRIAKERDTDGEYAYNGMLKIIQEHFEIYYRNAATAYILGTYLECYDPKETSLKDFLKICRIWHKSSYLRMFNSTEEFKKYLMDEMEIEEVFEWEHGVYTTNFYFPENMNDNEEKKMITVEITQEEKTANTHDFILKDFNK